MVDKKRAVVARKHAALENICRRFLVRLSPTCPNTRAATVDGYSTLNKINLYKPYLCNSFGSRVWLRLHTIQGKQPLIPTLKVYSKGNHYKAIAGCEKYVM